MNIIYHCFGGAHSSVTTAAIHLGLLKENNIPSEESLKSIPYFDKQDDSDHGKLRFMGTDKGGNKVYIIGKRGLGTDFETVVADFLKLHNVSEKPLIVDTLPGVNFYMRIGGFLSRKLKFTTVGRPLVVYGTRKAYTNFVKIADNTKEEAKKSS